MIYIRQMTAADIPLGMRLKRQAGWNQLEADWKRALELEPDGCFVGLWDGQAAATTTTCIFGSDAWVALVLVEESLRGRGIGTTMMRHALDFLERRQVRGVWLDATPLGQPVYERLGFVAEFELARLVGQVSNLPSDTEPGSALPGPQVPAMSHEDIDSVVELDCRAVGHDRTKLLSQLCQEWPESGRVLRQDGRIAGFLLSRRGANAVQIGPCITDRDAGWQLLDDAFSRFAGQHVYVDIPIANASAVKLAQACGLQEQRRLLRMRRGASAPVHVSRIWASSGPEKG